MPELIPVITPAARRRRTRHDDRGAVATVVAILLAGGVLLGFLALVVDVGRLYVEREELQTGADAGALAVAKSCATSAPQCANRDSMFALAQTYADANSADGVSKVVDVCGRLGTRLPACPAAADNLTACIGNVPATNFVEVRLATELPDGSLVLPPTFAQTMAGNSGYDGTSVAACARATWQTPAQSPILALAISTCEWRSLSGGHTDLENPAPADERVVSLFPGASNCSGPAPDPPWRRPGPAAWLDTDSSCEVHLPLSKVLPGNALAGASPSCEARLRQLALTRQTVYLPVYDSVLGGFPAQQYRITYFAPFVVTGFVLGLDLGGPGPGPDSDVLTSWLTPPDPPCPTSTPERCVSGLFSDTPVPVSNLAGDSLIKLIG